ncbi:MAG: phosphate ABC transporter substrate-binding protein [Candidatus Fermentibacteria bacterium]|nr:phosphate ABC transporter substrate-binding protein [Candidatus Fermentibacteria bacterium]
MRRNITTMILLAGLTLVGACGEPDQGTAAGTESGETSGGTVEISVVGSTTVQPLAELLSEAYEAIDPNVMVTISGGGSSVGVKSAAEQTADIGMASREIKDSEIQDCPEIVIHTIARDGIAIVANLDIDVDGITMEQVRGIFSGEITDWSEVGGTAGIITVAAREEGSGTRSAFEDLVMDDALISEMAILQPSNGAIRTTVATTPGCISFISFGYLDTTTKSMAVDGALPTAENVSAGTYPVVRPLNMVTYGEPAGAVAEWLEFIVGEDGQAIVAAEGYLPI